MEIIINQFILLILDGDMKPCCVKIEKMKKSTINKTSHLFYKCYFCDKTCSTLHVLNYHIQKTHPDKTKFYCDFKACLHLFFTSEEEKNKHIKEQHSSISSDGQKALRCIYCNMTFRWASSLRYHTFGIHQNVMINCKLQLCEMHLILQMRSRPSTSHQGEASDEKKCQKVLLL
jgi:hypothetical protein